MSARIVLATFGSYGDLHPYLGLALELRRRGHRPVLASSPFYREYVEGQGVTFRPLRPDVEPHDRELTERLLDPWRGTEAIVRELLLPHLEASHADLWAACEGADLLVTHPIAFAGPILAAERPELRWASTVLAPISFFSRHDLPVFPPLPWTKRLASLPLVGGTAGGLLVGVTRVLTRRWVRPVRRFREARGLPPGGHPLFEGQHSPELVLALFTRQLAEPQPDWPPRTRVTGHVFYDGPERARRLSLAVEAFLAEGEPPIVFTLGTAAVAAPGSFFEESVGAARRLGRRALLLTGGAPSGGFALGDAAASPRDPAAPLEEPDGKEDGGRGRSAVDGGDILTSGYEPFSRLLPRAAAVVHHGGIGSTAQALRAGVPQLVVPHAHDQPDNAWRVERLGVARTLPAGRYEARRAAPQLADLLEDPGVAGRTRDVGERVRSEGGAAAACDELEALLGR